MADEAHLRILIKDDEPSLEKTGYSLLPTEDGSDFRKMEISEGIGEDKAITAMYGILTKSKMATTNQEDGIVKAMKVTRIIVWSKEGFVYGQLFFQWLERNG